MKLYKPRVHLFYYFASLLGLIVAANIYLEIENGKRAIIIKTILIIIGVVMLPYKAFIVKYYIKEGQLHIKGFSSNCIDIDKIKSIQKIQKFRNRPTTNINCLEIKYGYGNVAYVAPIEEDAFVKVMLEVNPNIIVNLSLDRKAKKQLLQMIGFVFFIFLIIGYALFKILIPMYLIKEEELAVDNGIFSYAYTTVYNTGGKFSHKEKCVDIVLSDSHHELRITEKYRKYWDQILDTSNAQKPVQFKFYSWLTNSYVLTNPTIIIDHKTVKPFEPFNKQIGIKMGSFFLLFIISGSMLLIIGRQYLKWQQ